MSSNPAWAQAVEAARQADYHAVCGCAEQMHQPECYAAMLRAALPHLIETTVEGMEWNHINALRTALYEIVTNGRSNPETYYVEYRAALLAALTDAAGRV